MSNQQYTIGFIGTGNIGGALIQAVVKNENYLVKAYDISQKALKKAEELGAIACSSIREVAAHTDILVLAIKYQYYEDAIPEIRENLDPKTMVISLAPGYTFELLKQKFGQQQRVIRAMPNTPAMIGAGMSSLAFSPDEYAEGEKDAVLDVFRGAGKAVEVREDMMDAAMAVSGCAPAYGYIFIEAMGDIGTALGLPRAMSYEMAAQALYGAARMVMESEKHPGELKDMVCTPAGTTIQGVMALEESGFRNAVIQAVAATYRKAKEM